MGMTLRSWTQSLVGANGELQLRSELQLYLTYPHRAPWFLF